VTTMVRADPVPEAAERHAEILAALAEIEQTARAGRRMVVRFQKELKEHAGRDTLEVDGRRRVLAEAEERVMQAEERSRALRPEVEEARFQEFAARARLR
jgi:hypothetical protein